LILIRQHEGIRIHIIEPHPDDAIGSAAALCFSGAKITVHTVCDPHDDRSGIDLTKQPESRKYISSHKDYGFEDYHWDLREREIVPYGEMVKGYQKNYGEGPLGRLKEVLSGIIAAAINENAVLSCPLGILHPMHMLVSSLVLELAAYRLEPGQLWIYIDHPYDLHSINTNLLQQAVQYARQLLGWELTRYDAGGRGCQTKAGKIVRAIYHDLHHAEFDGAFEKTLCSFYLPKMFAGFFVQHKGEDAWNSFARRLHLQKPGVLMVTSQAYPFIGGGGMANVVYGLGKTIQNFADQVRILLYCNGKEHVCGNFIEETPFTYQAPDGCKYMCRLTVRDYQGIRYYLLSVPELFRKQQDSPQPYTYLLLADIVLKKVLGLLDFNPGIFHCHDWQSAGIPLLLKTKYRGSLDCRNKRVLYTIHFYGYQGVCRFETLKPFLGLTSDYCERRVLKRIQYLTPQAQKMAGTLKPGLVTMMNAGIQFSDCVSTVSQSYAKELAGYPALKEIKKVVGIRNGMFEDLEDMACPYDENTFVTEKPKCKHFLQETLGFEIDEDTLLICMTARLEPIKGIDDVLTVIPFLMQLPVQLVVMGDEQLSNAGAYSLRLKQLSQMFPKKLCHMPFEAQREAQLYMASDLLLMPSHVESCGTVQMFAMHYGVVPAVSCISALKDSVTLSHKEQMDKGVGYFFYYADCWMIYEVILKALEDYKDKQKWNHMVWKNMVTDFGWANGSIKKYMELYHQLL